MRDWRYILTSLAGVELGELWQSGDRTLTIPLAGGAGGGTVSGQLMLDNPMVDTMIGPDPAGRLEVLVKAYRDGTLMFNGDLAAAEEIADSGQETFPWSAEGPLLTRLNNQLLGMFPAGFAYGGPTAQVDLGQAGAAIIQIADTFQYQGIEIGAITPSVNGYIGPWHAKPAGEGLLELSQALGAFDFELAPTEPTLVAAGRTQIATYNAAPVLGQARPAAIFEYGSGKRNLRAYRRPFDTHGMCNRAYHLAPGFPDSVEKGISPITAQSNPATINRRRREAVIQADLQPDALRFLLLAETVRVRGYPRETIFITPTANCDVNYGEHYKVGDVVEARAIAGRRGRIAFDALFRVYGAQFTVSDLGTETVELAVIDEAAQV